MSRKDPVGLCLIVHRFELHVFGVLDEFAKGFGLMVVIQAVLAGFVDFVIMLTYPTKPALCFLGYGCFRFSNSPCSLFFFDVP